ncbi:hypothetical protein Q3G72_014785 [Acer saccharum]|nr:hypothetical protein Q3G72_014785 [Acer saccharum]
MVVEREDGDENRSGSEMRRMRKQPECTEEADSTAIMMRMMENSNEDPSSVRTLKQPRLVWTPQLHKWLQFYAHDQLEPEELEIEWHEPRKKEISVRVGLYVHGTILGNGRSKSNQYSNTPLIQIGGVKTKQEMTWYIGKTMSYIYKVEMKKNGSRYRCIWGKVTRFHGNSGIAQVRFKSNKPPKLIGSKVRVFM